MTEDASAEEKRTRQLIVKTKDLMEVPPITVQKDATIDQVAATMWERNIGSVIVVDEDGTIAGILTERDILFAVSKSLVGKAVPVSSIMSKTKLWATLNQSIASVVEMMESGGVRHLPVIDKSGKPLGMISMRDALEIALPLLKEFPKSAPRAARRKGLE